MSQLALVYESQGNQVVKSRPIPEPITGQVQVRVETAGYGLVDHKIYDYGVAFVKEYPTVLGFDAAGEVTKVGPGVDKFKVGDRVAFVGLPVSPEGVSTQDRGAFQQYALADLRLATKIPSNVDYDSAATFPANGSTAAAALYGNLEFTEPWLGGEGAYKGEKIVILGGSSSLGSFIIQMAVLSGFDVITTSSTAHVDYLKSLGATHIIDRSAPDVSAQILAAAGGPLKYVIDSVSLPATQLLGVEIVQPQGKLVLVTRAQPATTAAAEAKPISVLQRSGLYVNDGFWDSLEGYFERGVIKFNRLTVLSGGLRSWQEAFDLYRKGQVSGTKLVMRPQETKQD
ncbi:chaperonin 10-like protein [Mycena latifolia]|nr:chaperonin 10-like protein [Mycena latifolia]